MKTPLAMSHLTCQVNNRKHGVEHTVYTSSDTSQNDLTLVVSTDAEQAHFTPGTLVSRQQASKGSGSLLYLKLTGLNMSDTEFQTLKVTADGWQSQNFNDADGKLVCLTPTAPTSLAANASLTFTLNDFSLANPPHEGIVSLALFVWRVPPITKLAVPDEFVTHCAVNVQPPPDTKQAHLPDVLRVMTDISKIVNSADQAHPLRNRLRLIFQAQDRARPQVSVTANTQFTLSFVYAADAMGYGALTTVEEVKGFTVTPDATVTGNWKVTPMLNVQEPCWILQPTGTSLLGSDDFDFIIDAVTTHFQPGPTTLYVAYKGIPGYQDGVYTQIVEKVPQVRVPKFEVKPDLPEVDSNGLAQVELTWEADDATVLTLDWRAVQNATADHDHAPPLLLNDQPLPPIAVTGLSRYPLTLQQSTAFTLIAEGEKPDNQVDNRVLMHCVASIKPKIEKFEVVLEDAARQTYRITWAVRGPQTTVVKLTSNGSFTERVLSDLSGTLSSVKIDATQILTLTATLSGSPRVERDCEVLPLWGNTETGALLLAGIDRTLALADMIRVRFGGKPLENCAPEITEALAKRNLGTNYSAWAWLELISISSEQSWYGKTITQWETPPDTAFPLSSYLPASVKSIVTLFEELRPVVSAEGTAADRDRWIADVKAKAPAALTDLHNTILASRPASLHKSLIEACALDILGTLPGSEGPRPHVTSSQQFLAHCCLRYLIGLQVQGNAALLNALVQSGSIDDQKTAIREMKRRYDAQEKGFADVISNASRRFHLDGESQYVDADWTANFVLGQFEVSDDKCLVGIRFANDEPFGPTNFPFIGVARMEDLLFAEAAPVEWVRMPESSRCNLSTMKDPKLDLTEIAAITGGIVTGVGFRLVGSDRLAVSVKSTSLDSGQIQNRWISNDAAAQVSGPLTQRGWKNQFHVNSNWIVPSPAAPLTGFALYVWGNGLGVAALTNSPGWRENVEAIWRKRTTTAQIHVSGTLFKIWISTPKTIHVPRGTVVTWQNNGKGGMSVDAGSKSIYSIPDNQSGSLTFDEVGFFPYTCTVSYLWSDNGMVVVV